jgi:hypothetical protein
MKRICIILIVSIAFFSCDTPTQKPVETTVKKELPNCLKASYLKEVLAKPPFGFIYDETKGTTFSKTNITIRGFEIIGDNESPHYYIQYDPTTDEIYNFGFEVDLIHSNINPKLEDVAKLFEVGTLFDSSAAFKLKDNFKPIFYDLKGYDTLRTIETKYKSVWMAINHDLFNVRKTTDTNLPNSVSIDISNNNKPITGN